MQIFQNISIRRKQMLIMMLTSSIVLFLACATFITNDVMTFRRDLVENTTVLSEAVGNDCAAAIDFNDSSGATEALTALRAENNIVSACVYSRDGYMFAVYQRDSAVPFVPPVVQTPGHEFTGDELHLFHPVKQRGQIVGTIFVNSDLKELSEKLMRFMEIAGLVLLASLLIAFALSKWLQQLITGPILRLAQTVHTLTVGKNYSVRATKQSNDELGQLVDGFNEMLAQIQQRDAALQAGRDSLEARVVERTTELANSNEALRESNEKFHQLANNITDAFWIRSPDMSEVHYVSPAFERIWGRSVASLHANPQAWIDFIFPEDRERVVAAFAALTKDAPGLDLKYRIVRPDGEVRWVRVRGFQVRDAANQLIRHIGIVTDITESQRLEAQLFQSQKMETVGKLAGGIAHEFNSILTAIIGQSELLLTDLPTGSPLSKNATEISKAAGRAATLTRQLLAYGRKQILQPEILNLNSILADMESTLRHLMGQTVDVLIVPAAGLEAIKMDPGQMEQVIVNIVMNAADAMPNGGKLTLETANVTLDPEYVSHFPELKTGEYVMLAITDTGAGMSPTVQVHVFEPFFTTKGVGKGTGLGLSTCYGIIKQSGGHIAVYSEPGRGAAFKIYLPRVEQEKRVPVQPQAPADLPRGTETILLVEDDPALREMAATLLRRLGYTVLAAADGLEALSLKKQPGIGHIDLLFTDVVMPHMSGKELADRVRALYPHTKILFASAYTENAIVHQGVLDKGVALLQKPFMPSALAHKVRAILDQQGAPEPDSAQVNYGLTNIADDVKTP